MWQDKRMKGERMTIGADHDWANEREKERMKDFEIWWHTEGSALCPEADEDMDAFLYRVTRMSWLNATFHIEEKE